MTSDKVVRSIKRAKVSWVQLTCCVLSLLAVYSATAHAQCTTKAVHAVCPTAMEAAQYLTSSNSMLPISNPSWSPSCPYGSNHPYIKITDFQACHYLGPKMPQGATRSSCCIGLDSFSCIDTHPKPPTCLITRCSLL